MPESDSRPLFAGAREELAGLAADLREMLALRWQLARLEVQAGVGALRRLAAGLALAAALLFAALPLLGFILAERLAGHGGLSLDGWLAVLALGLAITGAVLAGCAWRGFRRRFSGLEETLEEFREDLVWLEERVR